MNYKTFNKDNSDVIPIYLHLFRFSDGLCRILYWGLHWKKPAPYLYDNQTFKNFENNYKTYTVQAYFSE